MERDIRRRELDLEQSRVNLAKNEGGYDRQRRPSSQQQQPTSASSPPNRPQPSPSTRHLGAPPSPLQQRNEQLASRSSNQSLVSNLQDVDHAPYCGCDRCSASKYGHAGNITPSPHDLRPPDKPFNLRPEKPKGWMRRLSMPVGNAFSQKSSSNLGISSTSYGTSKSGGIFSLDGRKNGSVVSFAQEDGRLGGRRSYDPEALGNRSMTNLATTRR